jgi:hypothetical protein
MRKFNIQKMHYFEHVVSAVGYEEGYELSNLNGSVGIIGFPADFDPGTPRPGRISIVKERLQWNSKML